MRIIAVDDEEFALEDLMSAIRCAVPEAELTGFQRAEEALEYVGKSNCDVAFLDIGLAGINGIDLAKRLKIRMPRINIIFSTAYHEYTGEAFKLHASGYIMKPVTVEKVRQELEDLRYPVLPQSSKRIRIQTFGNFEVFLDHVPIQFRYNKTKELLAYLVDRNGALCTNGEIMGILWEDDADAPKRISYLKNIRSDLVNTFKDAGCETVICRQRGRIGIVPTEVSCDYYDWLEGQAYAINAYGGEYMSQYSWSEAAHGNLEQIKYNKEVKG